MKVGSFNFVLHSHIPYCRNAGRWPHGEEWLYEAAADTYLPLLMALYELKSEHCLYRLTLSLTPVLVEQLADTLVLKRLEEYLEEKISRAKNDVARFEKANEGHLLYLAQFYLDRYRKTLAAFKKQFDGNIIQAFKLLQDEGYIEIVASAATHAYLPLLERDSSIYGQLKVGEEAYRKHFGVKPRACWLPECGYRPAFYADAGEKRYIKPGIEHFLKLLDIGCFIAETRTLEGGQPVGKTKEEVIGPYGNIPKRYVVPLTEYQEITYKTTFLPYWVYNPEVAVIGRDNRTGMQVWSADWGYPGDFNYREFHKRDGISGLQYWKITGAKLDLLYKEYYDPYWAEQRVQEHSQHFADIVEEMLINFYQENGKFGIVAAAYDTELFGHWWFEGVDWLKQVLRHISKKEFIELNTISQYIEFHAPEDVLALPEGSWGLGGGHFTWQNVDNQWMLPVIHLAENKMETLVRKFPTSKGMLKKILNQAARELLLLESSDWAFLITTGQATEYARDRFGYYIDEGNYRGHVGKFFKLAAIAESGAYENTASKKIYEQLWEEDNIFPDIDYHDFENREQFKKR